MKKYWQKDTSIISQCKFSDKTQENIVNPTPKYSDCSVSTRHSVDRDRAMAFPLQLWTKARSKKHLMD